MMTEKPFLRALAGEPVRPPPAWLMRQAGRYLPEYRALRARGRSFLDFCYTPELAVEATLQPLRRFPLDAAILFSDILVVPDAMGADVRFVEGEGPRLTPLDGERDLSRLTLDRLDEHLSPVLETVRRLRAALPEHVALIGFSGAPWTLAAYMVEGGGSRDFARARTAARRQPAFFAGLVDRLTEAVTRYLGRQIEAGAETVQLFDSWAGALAPEERQRWCIEPTRRIVETLRRQHPQVPVICFPRGIGAGYIEFAGRVPCQGLSLDTTVSMSWAARNLPPDLCLQGNLDPLALLGPVETLLTEADGIVDALDGRPLIFNLGHGVQPETDPASVAALVQHLKSRA